MGGFRQFGRLFWKNYVLRKRQPFVLLLELIWPLAIFAIIVIIRNSAKPEEVETCSYKDRSYPSAGLVPFIQSSVCNLQGSCQNEERIASQSASQQRLVSLLDDVGPILQKESTKKLLTQALPVVDKLITALQNTSGLDNLTDIGDRLMLKNLVRDPEVVVKLLVEDFKLLPEETARELMESTLNFNLLLQEVGTLDFDAIVCTPSSLASYVVFRSNVDVSLISKGLCKIENDKISNLTNALIAQLDISNIIEIAAGFASYTGEVQLATMLKDVAMLFDQFVNSPNIMASLGGVVDLSAIPDMIKTLAEFLPQLERMKELDLAGLSAMVGYIKPLLPPEMSELFNGFDEIIKPESELMRLLKGEQINMTRLLDQMNSVSSSLGALTNDTAIQALLQVPSQEIGQLINSMMGTNTVMDPSMGLNSSLDNMQNSLEMLMSVRTAQAMMQAGEQMLMITKLMSAYQEATLQPILAYTTGPAMTTIMTAMASFGHERSHQILNHLVQPAQLREIMAGNVKDVCSSTMDTYLSYMHLDPLILAYQKSLVCPDGVTDGLRNIMLAANYSKVEIKMQEHIDQMDKVFQDQLDQTKNVTLRGLYYMGMEVAKQFANNAIPVSYWTDLFTAWPSQVSATIEWQNVWTDVRQEYTKSNVIIPLESAGPMLEDTSMMAIVGPIFVGADIMMTSMVEQREALKAMSDGSSVMGQMMQYVEYLPDIMGSMMKEGEAQKFADMMQTDGLDTVICKENYLQTLNMSSEVPVDDMQDLICTTNWTMFAMDMESMYDMTQTIKEMSDLITRNMSESTVTYDWSGIEDMVDMATEFISNPMDITTGPWDMLMTYNFTAMGEKLEKMMANMQYMQVQDVVGYNTIAVGIMEQLDGSLKDVPYWRYAKYYMNTWMTYTKIINQYLKESKAQNFNITSFVKQMSPTLGAYLEDSSDVVPEVLIAMNKLAQQPQVLLQGVFNFDWLSVCNGSSMMSLLAVTPNSNTAKFEEGLCNLNWTAINMEIYQYDPNLAMYYDQLNILMDGNMEDLPNINLNWTMFAAVSEEYMLLVGNLTSLQSIPNFLFPNQDNISNTWEDFSGMLNITSLEDLSKLTVVFSSVLEYLDTFQTGDNNTDMMLSLLHNTASQQIYMQYHIYKFITKQLQYFNRTGVVDLQQYFNSEEMNNVFRLQNSSLDVNLAMIHSVMDIFDNSTKVNALVMVNFTEICNDLRVFSDIFSLPSNVSLTLPEFQQVVCGVNLNTTKLMMELEQSLDGFSELMQSISTITVDTDLSVYTTVNATMLYMEYDKFNALFQGMIMNPPILVWNMPYAGLAQQYEDALAQLMSRLDNATGLTAAIQQSTFGALESMLNNNTELSGILHLANYFMLQLESAIRTGNGSAFEIGSIVEGLPEMQTLVKLMDSLPELYLTYTYTSLNEPQKVSAFTTALSQGLEVLCVSDPSTLMTVPPNLDFSFSTFLNTFCTINMTALEHEFYQLSGLGPDFDEFMSRLQNMTAINMQDFQTNSDRLQQAIMELFAPNNANMTLPRFLDMDIWNSTLERLGELMPNDTSSLEQLPESLQNLAEINDPQLARVVATMNVIVDVVIARLSNTQGNISAAMLVQNSTELLAMLDSIGLLVANWQQDNLTEVINIDRLTGLFNDLEMLTALCDGQNLSLYISTGQQVSEAAKNIENLLCVDTDMVLVALQDQVQLEQVQQQIEAIWNMNNTVSSDVWLSFNNNINELSMLLTMLSMNGSAALDDGLLNWIDFGQVLAGIERMLTNPNSISALTGVSLSPVLSGMDVLSATAFVRTIAMVLDDFNVSGNMTLEMLLSDQNTLTRFMDMVASLDTGLIPYYEEVLLKGQFERFGYVNCSRRTYGLPQSDFEFLVVNYTPQLNMELVEQSICGQSSDMWFSNLQERNFTMSDMYSTHGVLVGLMIAHGTPVKPLPSEADDYVASLQALVTRLSTIQTGNLTNVAEPLMSWLNTYSQTMNNNNLNSLEVLLLATDPSMVDEIKRSMSYVIAIQQHMLDSLNVLQNSGWTIPITEIFPNSTALASVLSDAIGQQSSTTLMLAAVHLGKVFELFVTGDWKQVVCDLEQFRQTFILPNGTDIQTIQQDLCAYAQTGGTALTDLMTSVRAQDLMTEIKKIMNQNGDTLLNMSMITGQLSADTTKLIEMFTMMQSLGLMEAQIELWAQPILNALSDTENNMDPGSYLSQCEEAIGQVRGIEMYTDLIKPVLDSVNTGMALTNIHMLLARDFTDAVCGKPESPRTSAITVEGLIAKLNQTSFQSDLKLLLNIYNGNATGLEFTCQRLTDNSAQLTTILTETFESLDMEHLLVCLSANTEQLVNVLQNMSTLVNIGNEMSRLIEDEYFAALLGNEDLMNAVQMGLDAFNQQQQNVETLTNLVQQNITSVTEIIEQATSLSPDIISSLANQILNIDVEGMTAEELLDILCDPVQLEATFPGLDVNITGTELIASLCGPDRNVSIQIANSLTQLAALTSDLQGLENLDFINDLSLKITDLVKNIEGISYMATLLDDLQRVDFGNLENTDLLNKLQRLLVDSGPDNLIKSLNEVLHSFEGVIENNSSGIFSDIEVITRQLLSFNSLRDFLFSNFRIADFLRSPEEFKRMMMHTYDVDEDVVDAILDGSLSFELLLNASQKNWTEWVCDSQKLSDLLSNNTKLNTSHISQVFCMMDTDTASKLVDQLIVQIDIGDLMEQLITSGFTSALRKSGVTLQDTEKALKEIAASQSDLTQTLDRLSNYTSSMESLVSTLALGQTGISEFASFSELLCGEPVDNVEDSFFLKSKLQSVDELTAAQKEEMKELPAGFCQDLYTDIMMSVEGPIVWTYLKPLIRGKILVTPDTPEIQQVVGKINTTFDSLVEAMDLAKSWADGSHVLERVLSKEMQDVLKNPMVESLLEGLAGVSTDSLFDPLYKLNNTNKDLIKGLSNAGQMMVDYMSCLEVDRFVFLKNEKEVEIMARQLGENHSYLAGIVFTNVETQGGRKKRQTSPSGLPKHVQYKIRMEVDNVQHTNRLKHLIWRPIPEDNFEENLRYLRGFVQLQDLLDRAIISVQTGQDMYPSVTSKQFPYPCHRKDDFLNAIGNYLLPVLMTFAWVTVLAVSIHILVSDRENGQLETQQAMGLNVALNWWAWFISTILIMAFVSIIAVIILHFGQLFENTDVGIFFLYFLAFCFSAINLCFFVSSFFTQTSLAILASLIVYLVSYLPYVVLLTTSTKMTFWQKALACLLSPSAFGFSAEYLTFYEEQRIGIQWDNIASTPVNGDEFSFSFCCWMMFIDGFIYMILGWYVRQVKPGKFGVAQPWYFPVCPQYWGCCSPSAGKDRTLQFSDLFQPSNTDSPVAISVRHLYKKYGSKTVVDDLNMDIHSGQVTALLGHNGAAKTTTMNMLFGLLAPTKGEVRIFNRPQQKMRHDIGVCPQHNALYSYMTVQEHMEFYHAIKSGSASKGMKEEIKQLLKDVDMLHMRYTRIGALSGGMQRRLCIALAFVGDSRVVVLDEPTSGIDPNGRRAIWNLIIQRKSSTAILLSTHHLDEADVLGDRVNIMHQGKLMCSGSPMFLKQTLTSGHRIIIVADKMSENDPAPILSRLRQHVPDARLMSIVGNEMTFTLPTNDNSQFFDLFSDLESNLQALNIISIGIADPTLEEVFLKVSLASDMGRTISRKSIMQEDVEDRLKKDSSLTDNADNGLNETSVRMGPQSLNRRVNGCSWGMQQFSALMTKRFHHYRRDWRMFISFILLPILTILIAMAFYTLRPQATTAPNLLLTPAMYGPNTYVFTKDTSGSPFSQKIVDTFMEAPGIGPSCMPAHSNLGNPFRCTTADASLTQPAYTAGAPDATCHCNDYRFQCDAGAAGMPPKEMVTTTTDILQDLGNRNVTDYLLESYHSFIEKRYGGFSFTNMGNSVPSSLKDIHTTVWYNTKGYHALPAFYNAFSNAVLRSTVTGDPTEYGITAYNHPFKFGMEQLSRETLIQSTADLGINLMMLVAFNFIPIGFALYLVNEYVKKEKHLQFISGVTPSLYWFSALLWDGLCYCIPVALTVAIIAIFQFNIFWSRYNLAAVVVMLLLYGWATLPLVYATVKCFNQPSSAYFTMFCVLNFIGIITMTIVFSLNFFSSDENLRNAHEILRYVFLIFGPYCLCGGLLDLASNQIQADIFERFNIDSYVNPFSLDLLGWNMIAMAIQGVVFFILVIILDKVGSCSSSRSVHHDNSTSQDEDVLREKHEVDTQRGQAGPLLVHNLSKMYKRDGNAFLAVDHINFKVSKGECFGLLGVNGAGKTTTFNMLTGDLNPNGGHAFIQGHRAVQGSRNLGQQLGYCPQAEALDAFLSVEEILYFYAKLRGLPGSLGKMAVKDVMDKLNLNSIADKTIKTCSGGMRRKVSLAIALIGDPELVLLDEPTSGMDPATKRSVWKTLQSVKQRGQAVVLTSHSMEECDALCSRLSIMVNGQMKCLGTPQHLKDRFGNGYTVTLFVNGMSHMKSAINELQTHFPSATVRDHHQNVFQLDIPRLSTKVSTIFQVLENEKQRFNISYYTVSQTTLDTIFLNFARDQTDGTGELSSYENTSSCTDESYSESNLSSAVLRSGKPGYMNPSYADDEKKMAQGHSLDFNVAQNPEYFNYDQQFSARM